MTIRIRSIRPELYEHELYARMSRDGRRVLVELMSLADDEGRLRCSGRHLRAQRYAYDDDLTTAQLEGWIAEVERAGWIRRYQAGGDVYAVIVGWADKTAPTYQVINRPTESRLPPPPAAPPPATQGAITEPSVSPHGSISEPSVSDHGSITEGSVRTQGAITDRSLTDLDLEAEEERDLHTPRTREAPPGPPGVCGEAEFLRLWTELAAGKGRIGEVLMLSGTDRANLHRIGKPAAWWREVLEHVDRSALLRGEVHGFTLSPGWLFKDNGAKAHAVHAGGNDDAPPPGTVRTSAGATLTEAQLARLTAWCVGWTKGAGIDGHVVPAEPPSARTAERDRVLAPLLDRWGADRATEAWATPIAAEGAAAFLRSQVTGGKRRSIADLAKLARSPDLEEAMRRGEAYRRKQPPAPPPVATSAPTRAPPRAERPDETPAQRLVRLRAIQAEGMGGEEIKARIAALEREVGEDRGGSVLVLDEDTRAQREGRRTA